MIISSNQTFSIGKHSSITANCVESCRTVKHCLLSVLSITFLFRNQHSALIGNNYLKMWNFRFDNDP